MARLSLPRWTPADDLPPDTGGLTLDPPAADPDALMLPAPSVMARPAAADPVYDDEVSPDNPYRTGDADRGYTDTRTPLRPEPTGDTDRGFGGVDVPLTGPERAHGLELPDVDLSDARRRLRAVAEGRDPDVPTPEELEELRRATEASLFMVGTFNRVRDAALREPQTSIDDPGMPVLPEDTGDTDRGQYDFPSPEPAPFGIRPTFTGGGRRPSAFPPQPKRAAARDKLLGQAGDAAAGAVRGAAEINPEYTRDVLLPGLSRAIEGAKGADAALNAPFQDVSGLGTLATKATVEQDPWRFVNAMRDAGVTEDDDLTGAIHKVAQHYYHDESIPVVTGLYELLPQVASLTGTFKGLARLGPGAGAVEDVASGARSVFGVGSRGTATGVEAVLGESEQAPGVVRAVSSALARGDTAPTSAASELGTLPLVANSLRQGAERVDDALLQAQRGIEGRAGQLADTLMPHPPQLAAEGAGLGRGGRGAGERGASENMMRSGLNDVPDPLSATPEEMAAWEAREAAQAGKPHYRVSFDEAGNPIVTPGERAAAERVAAADRGPGNPVNAGEVPDGPHLTDTPTPTPAAQPGQHWARPLSNAELMAGGFREDTMRRAANVFGKVPGLRQAMSAVNPSALANGIEDRALIIRNRVLEMGEAAKSAGLSPLRVHRNPFEINGEARVMNLRGRPLWYDVFDSPGRYKLTPEQTVYVKHWLELQNDAAAMVKEAGIDLKEMGMADGRNYVHRLVEEIRGLENKRGGVGARVGSKAGFQKPRLYDWAEDAVANGVRFSPDPLAVMDHYVTSAYRLVADKRLADLIAPLGETAVERLPKEIGVALKEALTEYTAARRLLQAVRQSYAGLRLAPATLKSIAKTFPHEAAALRNSGPDNPALQAIERQALVLMQNTKAKYYRVTGERARLMQAIQQLDPSEGMIAHPAFAGRIFPKEIAERMGKNLAMQPAKAWVRAALVPSTLSRTIGAGLDFGAPIIQGLPLLVRQPKQWAAATFKHFKALVDPMVRDRFIAEHYDTAREMVRYGVQFNGSEFYEAVQGLRTGAGVRAGLSKAAATVGRQTVGRFENAYSTFMDASSVYMWEAMAPRWAEQGGKLHELAEFINHARGTMSTRALGVGATQRTVESTFMMFAPRYTRAGFALIADAATGGMKGAAARQAFANLAMAGLAMYLGTGAAAVQAGSETREEVLANLSPVKNGHFNSQWLTRKIGTDHVGIGGFYYWFLRTLIGTGAAAINNPGDLLTGDERYNPLLAGLRTRLFGAPYTGMLLDITLGRSYIGEPVTFDQPMSIASAVAQRFLPFWSEAYLLQEPRGSIEALPFQLGGFRVFPESWGEQVTKLSDDYAKAEGYDKPFADLRRDEQRTVIERHPDLAALRDRMENASKGRVATNDVEGQTRDYFLGLDAEKDRLQDVLKPAYEAYMNHRISGAELLKRRAEAIDEQQTRIQKMAESYPKALKTKAERDAYYSAHGYQVKAGNPDDLAAAGYYAIKPKPDGMGGLDMQGMRKEQKEYLNSYSPETQKYILDRYPAARFKDKDMQGVEDFLRTMRRELEGFWDIDDRVDALGGAFSEVRAEHDKAKLRGDVTEMKRIEASTAWKMRSELIKDAQKEWRGKNPDGDAYLREFYERAALSTPTPTKEPTLNKPGTQAWLDDYLAGKVIPTWYADKTGQQRPQTYEQLPVEERRFIAGWRDALNQATLKWSGGKVANFAELMDGDGRNDNRAAADAILRQVTGQIQFPRRSPANPLTLDEMEKAVGSGTPLPSLIATPTPTRTPTPSRTPTPGRR